MFSAPAIAHNVEIAGDVAGTWHIEPNENPKAGEPAKVWIALTRKGGEVLPLDQANCKLAVYPQSRTEGERPILQPPLKAIAAEKYQGIPGADVIFPAPGLYEMELSCAPKKEGDFAAFKMQGGQRWRRGQVRLRPCQRRRSLRQIQWVSITQLMRTAADNLVKLLLGRE